MNVNAGLVGTFRRNMTIKILRRAGVALLTAVLGLGLAVASTDVAEARTLGHLKVGQISGEYWVAGKNYDGSYHPSMADQCVKVQRKAGGVWRDNVSTTASSTGHCAHDVWLSWWIHDDTLAVNTTAIRLVVISGSYQGSYVVFCTSQDDCQQT